MSVIIAFVSQKGGTGKSTLARALGAVVAAAGLKVRIADLDPQQRTVLEWERLRQENRNVPPLLVEAFRGAAEALKTAQDDELLILDAPAHASSATLQIAAAATLVVQPSSASIDDLRPAVLLFHELIEAGIPRERLAVALCRILTPGEEKLARQYLAKATYDVLPGCIPERALYRDAHSRGHAVTETDRTHNAQVETLMEGLYARVAQELVRARRTRKRREKP